MLRAEQFQQDTEKFWAKMDQIGKVVAAAPVRSTSRSQRAVAAAQPKPTLKKRKH
jgi:hypothetical protein